MKTKKLQIDLSEYTECYAVPGETIADIHPEINNRFGRDVSYANILVNIEDRTLIEFELRKPDHSVACHGLYVSKKQVEYWRYEYYKSEIPNDPFEPRLHEFIEFYYSDFMFNADSKNKYLSSPLVGYRLFPDEKLEMIRFSLSAQEYDTKPLLIIEIDEGNCLRIIDDFQSQGLKVLAYPSNMNDRAYYFFQDFTGKEKKGQVIVKNITSTEKGRIVVKGFKEYSIDYFYDENVEKDLQECGFLPQQTRQLLLDETIFVKYIPTVNYHLIRNCNMQCMHCFSDFEEMTTNFLDQEKALQIIEEVSKIKTFRKINFSGGEPTIYTDIVKLISKAKSYGLETSMVTNGFMLTQKNKDLIGRFAGLLDLLALSVDSFDDDLNIKIGRHVNKKVVPFDDLKLLCDTCHTLGIKIKLNTVVTKLNFNEVMCEKVIALKPIRWKILRMLSLSGQNDNASDLISDDSEFETFIQNNKAFAEQNNITVVTEGNQDMTASYLMIGPDGCFFNNIEGRHNKSNSILEVGIKEALAETPLIRERFYKRDGDYSCD